MVVGPISLRQHPGVRHDTPAVLRTEPRLVEGLVVRPGGVEGKPVPVMPGARRLFAMEVACVKTLRSDQETAEILENRSCGPA